MLNPFPQTRLSKCPKCQKLTFPRKFALLIHVDGFGPYVQGKTCRYCSRCEMIMCQQDELEEQLAHAFAQRSPEVLGNEYLVLGTVETKTATAAFKGAVTSLGGAISHVAQFKKHFDLEYDPGGYRPAGAPPRYLEPTPPPTSWRLRRPPPAAPPEAPAPH
jgi:hypothetical protein